MQFLRTIFWVVIAVLAVIFAFANWTTVTVNLWSGLQLDTRLPVLLLVTFLIGLVPPFILYRTTRWQLKRRIDTAERALAERQIVEQGRSRSDPMPPGAAPMAVPPGCA